MNFLQAKFIAGDKVWGWSSGPSETEPEVWVLGVVTEVTGAGKSLQYAVTFDDGRQEKLNNKQVAMMIYYYGTPASRRGCPDG